MGSAYLRTWWFLWGMEMEEERVETEDVSNSLGVEHAKRIM